VSGGLCRFLEGDPALKRCLPLSLDYPRNPRVQSRPPLEAGEEQTTHSPAEAGHPEKQGRTSEREGQAAPSVWVLLFIAVLDIGSVGAMLVRSEHLPMTGSCNPLSLEECLKSAPQALSKKSLENPCPRQCVEQVYP